MKSGAICFTFHECYIFGRYFLSFVRLLWASVCDTNKLSLSSIISRVSVEGLKDLVEFNCDETCQVQLSLPSVFHTFN